jgi:hypothetical protein
MQRFSGTTANRGKREGALCCVIGRYNFAIPPANVLFSFFLSTWNYSKDLSMHITVSVQASYFNLPILFELPMLR